MYSEDVPGISTFEMGVGTGKWDEQNELNIGKDKPLRVPRYFYLCGPRISSVIPNDCTSYTVHFGDVSFT